MFKENWECSLCTKDKYPFMSLDNDKLHHTLNSNTISPSKRETPHAHIDNSLKLLLTHPNQKDTWNTFNFEGEHELEQNSRIKSNFKYYEVSELQKLSETWEKEPNFSIFHTNICSLNANVENMENLLHDTGIMFDILALSETWNSEQNKDRFNPKQIDGYSRYYGVTGTSVKGGCGFYVKESLNYIPRRDLDFKIYDGKHETESSWIELPNGKNVNIIVGVIYRHPSKQDLTFTEK